MKNAPDAKLYRILDANFNRAKEGLRVCEDICRYVWDNKSLTGGFKNLRHDLTAAVKSLGFAKIVAGRQASADVGRPTSRSESLRRDLDSVLWANTQRVKESLRVLEEIAKLLSPASAERLKNLRYRMYVLEQKVLKKR